MRAASFGPTPGPRATEALSPVAIASRARRVEHRQDAERHLGADALHGLEQAEPLALGVDRKP
jgi:hypothetical protein